MYFVGMFGGWVLSNIYDPIIIHVIYVWCDGFFVCFFVVCIQVYVFVYKHNIWQQYYKLILTCYSICRLYDIE